MSSQKKPINPVLDMSFKNFIERKADKFDMGQSGFLSKLIDAFRLYQESHSGTEDQDFRKDDRSTVLKGLNSVYAPMYIDDEWGEAFDLEKRSQAYRFYVTPEQKKWLKDQLGISDTVKIVLAFYMEAKLDQYLPAEIRHEEKTIRSEEFQPLSEEGGE